MGSDRGERLLMVCWVVLECGARGGMVVGGKLVSGRGAHIQ